MAARLTAPVPARRRRSLAALAAVGLALVLTAAACTTRPKGPTYPPAGVTPAPAGAATDAARAAVVAALGAVGLQATDPQQAYRPPEGPWFASAPRTVLQVQVPNEASPRFIVLYALASPADAVTAGTDEAQYVSHGAGKVMFPNDSHFVIRVTGSTAIFFTWSPGGAEQQTPSIEDALDTIGTGVAIPA